MNNKRSRSDALAVLRVLLGRSAVRRELLSHLIEGRSRKEIARLMSRSQHTVDAHLKAIYRAVGYGDRAILILLVAELQLESPPPPGIGDS
jgi:DNA-binding NarL/FixJ family response regulator